MKKKTPNIFTQSNDIKFPLQQSLLLFLSNGRNICGKIVWGGKDFVTIRNVQEQFINGSGEIVYIAICPDNSDLIFKRDRIDGYTPFDNFDNDKEVTPAKILPFKKKDKK